MRPPLLSLWALVVTTWSGAAVAQGAPAPPPAPPAVAPMTVPGTAPPTGTAPTQAPPPPPPGDGRFVLAPAPNGVAPPAPAPVYPTTHYAVVRPAEGRYDPYVRRPLVLEGHTAFGGPTGWIGVGVDYSLSRYFAVMGGVGLGQAGPQASAMARLRVPMDTVSAGFGAGFSAGEYEDGFFANYDRYRWDTAYWFNTEGFIEIRSRKGINIRPYMGSGVMLNRDAGKPLAAESQCLAVPGKPVACADVASSRDRNPFLFYMGAAIGYAFEL